MEKTINFSDERLVLRYKNWVKVQVAFYDFIMHTAIDKEQATWLDIVEFGIGGDGYENMIASCFDKFETPEVAWELFLKHEGL